MPSRWVTTIVFVLISAAAFFFAFSNADDTASEIAASAQLNESTAESAPQQDVVASWAIRDAEIEQIRQNGIRNGLLGVCAAMLISIAVSLAFRERREALRQRGGSMMVEAGRAQPPLTP